MGIRESLSMTKQEKNELALGMGLFAERKWELTKMSIWTDKQIKENYPELSREDFNIKLINSIEQAEAGIFLCREFLGLNKTGVKK
jgi:hypothetical protein